MRCAVYARKSTEDDRNEENRSVTRQIDNARAFAIKNGWEVSADHIFVDDGISGAEFKNRPGLIRMLNHLKEFDVLIISELSRIGREQSQTANVLANLQAKGVQIFLYLTKEELKFETAIDKVMVSLVSFAAELEREKSSQRSRDALERKARKGFNTGGACYGCSNVQVFNTNGKGEKVKSHTDYEINPEEAEVIQSIFRMYVDGYGLKRIALTLNGDNKYLDLNRRFFNGKSPTPIQQGQKRGTGSWCPSVIKGMLSRKRYIGKIPFGHYKNVYMEGTKKRKKMDDGFFADRPELRIIDQDLWEEVQRRQKALASIYLKDTNGNLWGRPDPGRESRFLLSGIGRCGECGASIVAINVQGGPPGARYRTHLYGCSYRYNRGEKVCKNSLRGREEDLNDSVLSAIEERFFTPDGVSLIIQKAIKKIKQQRGKNPSMEKKIQGAIRELHTELSNFTKAIASGGFSPTILTEINKREERIKFLENELNQHRAVKDTDEVGAKRMIKDLEYGMTRFREILLSDVPTARQGLRKLLDGPIIFSPTESRGRKFYSFRGNLRLGALLQPIENIEKHKVGVPSGIRTRVAAVKANNEAFHEHL